MKKKGGGGERERVGGEIEWKTRRKKAEHHTKKDIKAYKTNQPNARIKYSSNNTNPTFYDVPGVPVFSIPQKKSMEGHSPSQKAC